MQSILTGAVILFNLVLGFAVFLNNKKRPVNIAFSLFVLGVVGWTISNYLADNVHDFSGALFWVRASFAFTSLMCANLFLFSNLFAETRAEPRRPLLILAALAGAFMFFFSFTPGLVRTVELKTWGANTINGPFFWVFLVFFAVTILGSAAKLIWQYRLVKGEQRQQVQYLFFGLSLSVLFGAMLNLIIPLVTGTTDLAKYGPFGTVFLIFFTSVAIVRHRLLDIRLLVLKSVAYTMTLGAVIAGYVSFTYLLFQKFDVHISRTFVNIGTFLLLLFTFNPVQGFIERRTDRLFFKNRYDFNELLSDLTNITKRHSRSINALTAQTLAALAKEMRLTKAAFILTMSSQTADVHVIGYEHKARTAWGRLMRVAIEAQGVVLVDDLGDGSDEKNVLREFDADVVVPIRTEQATPAAIVLGEKRSGDPFNQQDVKLLELVGPHLALALENAKSFVERGQRIAELKSINKMFRHIEHFLDLDKLLQEIVDEAIMVTRADGGSLMLTHDGGQSLTVKTSRNLHPRVALNAKIKTGEGIAGAVAATKKPLIINGSNNKDYRHDLKREDLCSAISAPMMAEDKLVGVLNINRKKNRPEFTEENLNIINAFAAQAAEAIVKAGHYRQIEKLSLQNDRQFREFIKALSRTVDAKDPYTFGHSEEVTRYCLAIAHALALSEQETRDIEIGSRLHDMGKIGVPEAILNKPGKLDPRELATVQRHPEIAADILKETESLKDIRDLILYHHEHWDGSGYPAGLKGEEIPLGSRILSVADSYDAMCSRRAYRAPLPQQTAVAELKRCAGTQFDPDIVDVFLAVIDGGRLKLVKNSIYGLPEPSEGRISRINRRAA